MSRREGDRGPDDHAVFRFGMRTPLGALPDMTVVGEAATGEEAVALYRVRVKLKRRCGTMKGKQAHQRPGRAPETRTSPCPRAAAGGP
jgi:hypothetical protein